VRQLRRNEWVCLGRVGNILMLVWMHNRAKSCSDFSQIDRVFGKLLCNRLSRPVAIHRSGMESAGA
jgi:hypothetical protein